MSDIQLNIILCIAHLYLLHCTMYCIVVYSIIYLHREINVSFADIDSY